MSGFVVAPVATRHDSLVLHPLVEIVRPADAIVLLFSFSLRQRLDDFFVRFIFCHARLHNDESKHAAIMRISFFFPATA